eukprot:jgi/Bigna1/74303/fgenesh1_pg.28_\
MSEFNPLFDQCNGTHYEEVLESFDGSMEGQEANTSDFLHPYALRADMETDDDHEENMLLPGGREARGDKGRGEKAVTSMSKMDVWGWPSPWSISNSVFLDTRYNACHLMVLLVYRIIISAWSAMILIWAGFLAQDTKEFYLSLTSWVMLLTVLYFGQASFFTLRDWILADTVEKNQLTISRRLAICVYEIAFTYSMVVFIVHLTFAPHADGKNATAEGSGSIEQGRGTSSTATIGAENGGIISGGEWDVRYLIDLHLHYACFVWLGVDSSINACEFRWSHYIYVLSPSILYMLVIGLNMYLWMKPSEVTTKTTGLTVLSWALLFFGIFLSFSVLLAWSEFKYTLLNFIESRSGYRDRPPPKFSETDDANAVAAGSNEEIAKFLQALEDSDTSRRRYATNAGGAGSSPYIGPDGEWLCASSSGCTIQLCQTAADLDTVYDDDYMNTRLYGKCAQVCYVL